MRLVEQRVPINNWGIGISNERWWIKTICVDNRMDFLGIQETLMTRLDIVKMKML